MIFDYEWYIFCFLLCGPQRVKSCVFNFIIFCLFMTDSKLFGNPLLFDKTFFECAELTFFSFSLFLKIKCVRVGACYIFYLWKVTVSSSWSVLFVWLLTLSLSFIYHKLCLVLSRLLAPWRLGDIVVVTYHLLAWFGLHCFFYWKN